MKRIDADVVVLGAGLTGLALAYFLRNTGLNVVIVEARDRIGGRINTLYKDGQAPIELGATWLGDKHSTLTGLLQELGIKTFEQILGKTAVYEPMSINPPQIVQLPPNDDPSYRIAGGTSTLINNLASYINQKSIYLNQPILSIEKIEDKISAKSADIEFLSNMVISTLPPFLLKQSINVKPDLPAELISVAEHTHTWMGDSIKVGLTYAKPFWRANNLSGTIFSNVGPIPEMYDHSNYEDNHYALKGFFNGSYHAISRDERLEMVLTQLRKYFGDVVYDYLSYEETVWAKENHTYVGYASHVLPHQNNGHAIYRNTFLDGKLLIGGAETADQHPGYMDGAVRSAQFMSDLVKMNLA